MMKGNKGKGHVLSESRVTRILSNAKQPAKTEWHALSLQQLTTPEFVRVVNSILADEYALLPDLFQEDGDISVSLTPVQEERSVHPADGIWAMTQDALAIEFA
ncbi:MAG: hypothetical protein HZB43_10870 [candidate division Zixibacteria bacterium]|nr:hypothetical protein [candidate division Zixibacteria bacterium]